MKLCKDTFMWQPESSTDVIRVIKQKKIDGNMLNLPCTPAVLLFNIKKQCHEDMHKVDIYYISRSVPFLNGITLSLYHYAWT